MKWAKLSSRERLLIGAAGTVVVFVALMWTVVLPFWDSMSQSYGSIDLQAKRVTNYRRILRGQTTVKAALDSAQKQTAVWEARLLVNKADALAIAEIQGLVKDLVLSQKMFFRRSDLLPAKIVSPEYTKVSARIEIMGTMDQFVNLLLSFETGPRILFVEESRISPVQVMNSRNKQVLVTLTVSALKAVDPGGSTKLKKAQS
jgi:Tfp pilus assembly protein PilO